MGHSVLKCSLSIFSERKGRGVLYSVPQKGIEQFAAAHPKKAIIVFVAQVVELLSDKQ